jgi:hypothetical protein
MRHAPYLALALAFGFSPSADASVEEAKRDVIQTYDFDPSTMSFDEQAKRAEKLGDLWTRFDESPDFYRDALRSLLGQDGGREMLYCDGGMLFLQNAVQATDKELGLRSIARCSLSEIQHTPYFYTMHSQALAGIDTVELQFKMLTKPKYQVFIPMHALTLGQDYSFVYPLLVQDETKYTSRLIGKTKTEKDPAALNTLLLALYYSAVPDAEAAIHSMAQSKTLPAEVHQRAELVEGLISKAREADATKVHEWIKQNEVPIAPNATEKELRDGRRKRMRVISDEALMELDVYTLLIYQARG